MNLGIANQFVTKGLLLDRGSLDWGPGVAVYCNNFKRIN